MSAESAILHAVIERDFDQARKLIAGLLPGERRALISQAYQLADLGKERDQLMAVVNDKCRWARRCPNDLIGYYSYRGTPYGVCAEHKPDVESADFVVHDLPQEVKL